MPRRPIDQAVSGQQVREFLGNFNIAPMRNRPLTFKQYVKVITVAKRWHGILFAAILADLFMPEGPAVEAGYEDSSVRYWFFAESWQQVYDGLVLL